MHLFLKYRYQISLVILILFHLFFNGLWIYLNKTPLTWDPANHAYTADTIKNCILNFTSISKCYQASLFYPIFSQSVLAVAFIAFGTSTIVSQIFASIIFALTIFVVYLWALKTTNNKKIALFTAFFFSFTPAIYGFSKFFWLEYPTILFLYLSLLYLNKSNNFSSTKYTYITLITVGFGVATRTYFVVYLIIPFLVELYNTIISKKAINKISKIIVAGLITLTIGLPWYVINFNQFIYYSKSYILADTSEPQKLLSSENITWYLNKFINEISMFNLSVIFILSLLFITFTALSKTKKLYLLANIAFVYGVFTIIANKDVRYMFALVPYISIIIATSYDLIINKIPAKFEKKLFLISTAIIFLLTYFTLTFNFPINNNIKSTVKVPILGFIDTYNTTNYPIQAVNTNKWPIKQILNRIQNESAGGIINFATYVEYPHLNNRNLVFGTKEYNYSSIAIYDDFEFYSNGHAWTENDLNNFLLKKDYILIPTNQSSPDYYIFKKSLDTVQNFVFNNTTKFSEIQRFKIPYKELVDYLKGSNLENVTSPAEEKCKTQVCDEVVLYKVKKNK